MFGENNRPFSAEENRFGNNRKLRQTADQEEFQYQDPQLAENQPPYPKGGLLPAQPKYNNFYQREGGGQVQRPQTSQPNLRSQQNSTVGLKKGNGQLRQEADYFKHNLDQFDKERLFEDLLQAKGLINELKEDNNNYKTKCVNQERDIIKYQKVIEEMQHSGSMKNLNTKFNTDSYLYVSLKKQVKDLQQEAKFKTQEIDKLKKNIKYTKFQELETEKKAFADETIRLRRIVENLLQDGRQQENQSEKIKQLEERCFLLNNIIETLRKDNTNMANAIRILEDRNQQVYMQSQQANKSKEIQQLKKQLKDKDQELQKNSKMLSPAQESKLSLENKKLQKDLELRDKKVSDLEKELKKFQNQNRKNLEHKQNKRPDSVPNNMKQRVKHSEVEHIAVEIKLKFMKQNISFRDMSQHLITKDLEQQGRASYNQLKEILAKAPFNFGQQENVIDLLCRYLTEGDTQEQFVMFDPDQFCNTGILKNKFEQLVGEYELIQEEELEYYKKEIDDIIEAHQSPIQQYLNKLKNNNNQQFITYKQLTNLFNECKIEISENLQQIAIQEVFNQFRLKNEPQSNKQNKQQVQENNQNKVAQQQQDALQQQRQSLQGRPNSANRKKVELVSQQQPQQQQSPQQKKQDDGTNQKQPQNQQQRPSQQLQSNPQQQQHQQTPPQVIKQDPKKQENQPQQIEKEEVKEEVDIDLNDPEVNQAAALIQKSYKNKKKNQEKQQSKDQKQNTKKSQDKGDVEQKQPSFVPEQAQDQIKSPQQNLEQKNAQNTQVKPKSPQPQQNQNQKRPSTTDKSPIQQQQKPQSPQEQKQIDQKTVTQQVSKDQNQVVGHKKAEKTNENEQIIEEQYNEDFEEPVAPAQLNNQKKSSVKDDIMIVEEEEQLSNEVQQSPVKNNKVNQKRASQDNKKHEASSDKFDSSNFNASSHIKRSVEESGDVFELSDSKVQNMASSPDDDKQARRASQKQQKSQYNEYEKDFQEVQEEEDLLQGNKPQVQTQEKLDEMSKDFNENQQVEEGEVSDADLKIQSNNKNNN